MAIQEFNGSVLVDAEVELLGLTQNQINAITTESGKSAVAVDTKGHLWQINGTTRTDLTAQTTGIVTDITTLESDVATLSSTTVKAADLLNLTYPVGAFYISASATSPASLFGGTWQQKTDDAYLKIVSSGGGTLGGTNSTHQIPLESLPSHNHGLNLGVIASSVGAGIYPGSSAWMGYQVIQSTNSTGGGQAYRPYYLGVYLWQRTA